MHFQTVIASKAARVRLAAPGKSLIDFGLRRARRAVAVPGKLKGVRSDGTLDQTVAHLAAKLRAT